MKFKRMIGSILLLTLCVTLLTGCQTVNDKGSNKELVQTVINAINLTENPVDWLSGTEWQNLHQLTVVSPYQPFFYIADVQLTESADKPDTVHYRCTVPGLVGATFNMLLSTCIRNNDQHSARVPLEGDLTIVTDAKGKRKIDISAGKDPLSLYVTLSRMNASTVPGLSAVNPSDGLSEDEFSTALNAILSAGCVAYADALGVSPSVYSTQTVVPELQTYVNDFSTFGSARSDYGYGFENTIRHLSTFWAAVVVIVLLAVFFFLLYGIPQLFGWLRETLSDSAQSRRSARLPDQLERAYIRKDVQPLRLLNDFVKVNGNSSTEFFKSTKGINSLRDYQDVMMRLDIRASNQLAITDDPLNSQHITGIDPVVLSVVLARNPTASPIALRLLCKYIQLGMEPDAGPKTVTAAGWAAAALGRAISLKMRASDIAKATEAFRQSIDAYNRLVKDTMSLQEECRKLKQSQQNALENATRNHRAPVSKEEQKKNKASERERDALNAKIKAMEAQIADAAMRLNNGLSIFIVDRGVLPLGYLLNILGDRQHACARFIKQGVIMGLIDWVAKNREHPEAKKILDQLVAERAALIQSDDKLSFYEVRVPSYCHQDSYAALLADVLHCANPSLTYCDTRELLNVAVKAIPDVMDLLQDYPLRLIDPANRQTQGFYTFKPFEHGMWVQYMLPINEGQVIRRYHEVQDMTVPLSAGLNLRLFTDPYAVIPTLYHEFEHYSGDPNEASVFLKTQVFSLKFYREYADANPTADAVFMPLQLLLGNPPSPGKAAALNSLIEKFYGLPLSLDAARAAALSALTRLNEQIDAINANTRWCPEVPMPRLVLSEEEPQLAARYDGTQTLATILKELDDMRAQKPDAGKDPAGRPVDNHSADMIYLILLHAAQVPRSVTEEEFRHIVESA